MLLAALVLLGSSAEVLAKNGSGGGGSSGGGSGSSGSGGSGSGSNGSSGSGGSGSGNGSSSDGPGNDDSGGDNAGRQGASDGRSLDGGLDHDFAKRGVGQSELAPLAAVLRTVRAAQVGQVVDVGLARTSDRRIVYRVMILSPDDQRWQVIVDAKNNVLIDKRRN